MGQHEVFLEVGSELFFEQASNNQAMKRPSSTILQQNSSDNTWTLSLDDGGGELDRDHDDLKVRISSHLESKSINNQKIASRQDDIQSCIFDFRSIAEDSVTLELSLTKDSDLSNELTFIRLDENSELPSIGDIPASNNPIFADALLASLETSNSPRFQANSNGITTTQWTLESDEFGLYAPALISEDGNLFTLNNFGFGNELGNVKQLGLNHFGFEDTHSTNNPDWDYNDLTVRISVL